jgi:hypothetical protein
MTRICCLLIASLLATGATTSSLAAPGAAEPGHPAQWRHHDMIVDLHNLPTRYSCNDLWYKFHDVLLALGARPDLKILTYRCGQRAGTLANSPSVQLQFSLPELLDPQQARWADVSVTPQTVRLTAGTPGSLHDTDCELLRQMKDKLLSALPTRITGFKLACAATTSARWPFNVSVRALLPSSTNPRVAARLSPAPKLTKRAF